MTDFEWCCDQVLRMDKKNGPEDLAWEDFIIRFLATPEYDTTRRDRLTWIEREPKHRTTLIYYAIEHLVQGKRIYAAPEHEQATGRRLFRHTNVLDSIVQSL